MAASTCKALEAAICDAIRTYSNDLALSDISVVVWFEQAMADNHTRSDEQMRIEVREQLQSANAILFRRYVCTSNS